MPNKTHFLLFLLMIACPACRLHAQDDSATKVCLSLLQVDVKDSYSVFGSQYHFSELQNLLKTGQFKSYGQLQESAGSLGISVPMLDNIVGFSGAAKNNTGLFQSELSSFLSSNYGQWAGSNQFSNSASVINSQLLEVIRNCQDKYFNTLRDRIQLSVEVEPESYTKVVVKVTGNSPQTMRERLVITQIEPADLVRCTENGSPAALGVEHADNQALLNCSKGENAEIRLVLRTNFGSPTVILPKKPQPEKPDKYSNLNSLFRDEWADEIPRSPTVRSRFTLVHLGQCILAYYNDTPVNVNMSPNEMMPASALVKSARLEVRIPLDAVSRTELAESDLRVVVMHTDGNNFSQTLADTYADGHIGRLNLGSAPNSAWSMSASFSMQSERSAARAKLLLDELIESCKGEQ